MKSTIRSFFYLAVMGVALSCLGLSACSKGPFSPEAKSQAADLNRYLNVLRSALVTDDTFEWNTLSSALIVRALPYTPMVAKEAEYRFQDDPAFSSEVSDWRSLPRGVTGPPVIVLMGVFAPDLKEKDITKLGRFRPRLLAADGRVIKPIGVKRFGRDSVFIRDHFPVFNRWEEVYLVKFESTGTPWPSGPVDFQLQWPGGAQNLILSGK